MAKRPRLGRGLDGLLPPAPPKAAPAAPKPKANTTARIEELFPNRKQPRRHFDDEALAELAASIAEHGVLEPILVRPRSKGGFEIIAGERRWRASQKAGLKDVPIFLRELSDEAAFEAAIVENLQREDLNPIETAKAFHRLVTEFGHSQDQVAKRVGKSRSAVANALRLLKLPDEVLELVADGQLSEGHGRALLTAKDVPTMTSLARQAAAQNLSVREVEKRARAEAKAPKEAPAEKSANVKDLERRLGHALGANVSIAAKGGEKGNLVIEYTSFDHLDALLARLGVRG